jgi:hypothetical protein
MDARTKCVALTTVAETTHELPISWKPLLLLNVRSDAPDTTRRRQNTLGSDCFSPLIKYKISAAKIGFELRIVFTIVAGNNIKPNISNAWFIHERTPSDRIRPNQFFPLPAVQVHRFAPEASSRRSKANPSENTAVTKGK